MLQIFLSSFAVVVFAGCLIIIIHLLITEGGEEKRRRARHPLLLRNDVVAVASAEFLRDVAAVYVVPCQQLAAAPRVCAHLLVRGCNADSGIGTHRES